ncbi:hypothetical protein EIW28_08630 [Glycomyces terrestris]|uniref:Glycoside hydrolase family 42 N-terminal domain-containing protein n=2 Tax=Glycomyces terrestris TaxID=2493553 RepID=A0A426V193_9ACTN|nr:hypothetical protein EIW28_08630 [Glycomyces terrestris]
MRKAGVNLVSVNIFAWASVHPGSGERDFERLDAVIVGARPGRDRRPQRMSCGAYAIAMNRADRPIRQAMTKTGVRTFVPAM